MKKKWLCLVIVLTLIVGTCMATSISSEAVSLDVEKECSMTIFPENPEKPKEDKFGADLETAKVQVDIYKVADAKKTPGYDTYSYTFLGDYKNLREAEKILNGEVTAGDWQELAQAAAKAVLGYKAVSENEEDIEPMSDPNMVVQNVSITADFKREVSLETGGLYLIIAKGEGLNNPEDYRVTMKGKSHTSKMDGDIATIANSENYTYIFAPQLISLPMKDAVIQGDDPESENGPLPDWNDNYMTSNPGDWVYDVSVYLKPVRVQRYGSLEISKKLQVYESEEEVVLPAEGGQQAAGSIGQDEKTTFVFRATWDNPDYEEGSNLPEKISKVDSITFPIIKENGEKVYDWQLYIDGIPVGTEVTVKEIYSGASYQIVGENEQTVTVGTGAENIKNGIVFLDNNNAVIRIANPESENDDEKRTEVSASVAFTNTYNGNQRKGYGINNEFEYDGLNWVWTNGRADQEDDVSGNEGTP